MKNKIINLHQPCPNPNCQSSDAYCEYEDGHGYCFSCRFYKPPHKNGEFIKEMEEQGFTYEYMPFRGITKETMEFFGVKTKINTDGKPVALGYPYKGNSYKIRNLESGEHYSQGDISKAGLGGKHKFAAGSAKAITVCEGYDDAMSSFQMLGSKYPCVTVQSASVAKRDCTLDRDYLNSFECIYLCFDNDDAGKRALSEVASLFDFNKIYHVQISKHKDANDYLQAGDGDEFRKVWWNSKRFLPEGIVSSLKEFEHDVLAKPKQGISYPFPTLDRMTYGLRTGETVLVTAYEGVGKTELVRSIEYKLLKETDYAIGAIFLEESRTRHLQGLAGLELQSPVHLPDCGASDSEVVSAIRRVVGKDDRLHIYSHFDCDDPDVILDRVRFMVSGCGCRFVLLDHITMVVSGALQDDERKVLDYLSTRLGMMVNDLDFGLVLVSHVNDDGLTRGSRNISKMANLWIEASRDLEGGSNLTNLKIKKNRYSGQTGLAGVLQFDKATYTLKEYVPQELPL